MLFGLNKQQFTKPLIIAGVVLLTFTVGLLISIILFTKVFPPQKQGLTTTDRIKTSSGVEGYALYIADPKALEQLLSDYGFWESYDWDLNKTRASHLYIVFTDKIQPLDKLVTQDQSVISSYGVTFDQGRAFLFIQIDPTIDNFATSSSKIVADYLGRFIYSIQPLNKKASLPEAEFLKSIYNGPELFSIVKT